MREGAKSEKQKRRTKSGGICSFTDSVFAASLILSFPPSLFRGTVRRENE